MSDFRAQSQILASFHQMLQNQIINLGLIKNILARIFQKVDKVCTLFFRETRALIEKIGSNLPIFTELFKD